MMVCRAYFKRSIGKNAKKGFSDAKLLFSELNWPQHLSPLSVVIMNVLILKELISCQARSITALGSINLENFVAGGPGRVSRGPCEHLNNGPGKLNFGGREIKSSI